jgi:hypothetical protein
VHFTLLSILVALASIGAPSQALAIGNLLVIAQANPPSIVGGEKAKQESPQSRPPAPQPSQLQNQSDRRQAGNVAERAIERKFGPEALDHVRVLGRPAPPLDQIGQGTNFRFRSPAYEQLRTMSRSPIDNAAGAPVANQTIDKAPRSVPGPEPVPMGTPTFQTRPTGIQQITEERAKGVSGRYGSQPGGVVLEGVATNIGKVGKVHYAKGPNALMLDDRAVYFAPVSAQALATIARAIAGDDRVGVSLGSTDIVYGSIAPDSEVVLDLKAADHFLGDIVFAREDWTAGYRFPNGFVPQRPKDTFGNVAVFFNFNGFEFRLEHEEFELARAALEISLVPLSDERAPDGGHKPDLQAIAKGQRFKEFEANAAHIDENINFYRQELIIRRMFAYGEVAAFLRGLKAQKIDLKELARVIEIQNGLPTPRSIVKLEAIPHEKIWALVNLVPDARILKEYLRLFPDAPNRRDAEKQLAALEKPTAASPKSVQAPRPTAPRARDCFQFNNRMVCE